ncbi:MAG: NAD(P)/FAD-dependent oxidoreductase, partial [Acidobacteria bacterium]|nr:NAD(P)/FAD-dependent oxidoreductase [Acidobacteriota bacterium]
GIILGSGHNSLVLQAYLGKAGLKVLCLESRDVAGGGLTTVEDPRHPGFLHNTHSFFHRGLTQMPWYGDLELERHGAVYLEPELNVALVLKSGEILEWWKSFEKTEESFARFSRKDAATLRLWRERFLPIVQKILIPESQSPPVPSNRRRALLERSAEGGLLLEVSALSPLEFVLREFEHPVIQAGLLFFNGLREVDLRCQGFGHHIPSLLASTGKAQMCRGGSAALARALVAAVRESGGEVKVQARPRRIIVENGRVAGVETWSGDIFRARQFVASGLNPQQTFLELIDPRWVSSEWRKKAQAFRYNLVAPLFALNLNLGEPPGYRAADQNPHLKNAFMVILGLEHFQQFPEIVQHHEAGTIPPTVMWGSCPTLFDSSQAPPEKHTAFMWEKLPYALNGDPACWDRERESHGEAMLNLWTEYAPNLKHTVLDWFVRSPLDIERTLPNMREGDLLVGALDHDQIGYHRPFPGAGHYRGHLPGLYLCGGCCHPGGNITGLPGYNSAQVILADLGLPAPWTPSSVEGRLEGLAPQPRAAGAETP